MNVVPNAASPTTAEPFPPAELVVQNGRMKGARRTLSGPLALIGQGYGCEVRLNVDGVKAMHCVIVNSLDGYVIRDLAVDGTTLVNGQRVVGAQPLKDGDLIFIGPFQFLIEVPGGSRPENLKLMAATIKTERDALRIQVAAVASQQAGLTEEEIKLEQRRLALQKQEEQLAARLDERQRELRELDERLRRQQATLEAECQAEEERLAQARKELGRTHAEQEKLGHELAGERQRLAELRQRFKRRWQTHWGKRKAESDRRDQALNAMQGHLHKETEKLEQERCKLTEVRLCFNGEMELGRRQLQEEWQKLSAAQQQWEDGCSHHEQELAQRHKSLEERERAVAQTEQDLQQHRKFWEHHSAVLELEVEGLENRIRNQRQKLQDLQRELSGAAAGESPADPVSSALVPVGTGVVTVVRSPQTEGTEVDISEGLKRIAGLVADQRWHLLEQWERLLDVQSAWEQERAAALIELEEASQHLQQREQRVVERAEQLHLQEQILEARLGQLHQRQESLSQMRCSLEGWQARLKLQANAWHSEREQILHGVRTREEAVAAQLVRAEELYRQRTQRLKQFAINMRKARLRCDLVRKHYASLWKTCQQQQQALLVEQQNVTRQTLALERFRQECMTQSSNPAAAEKRMDRLQRNCNILNAEAMRQIEREREGLVAEMTRLDERSRHLAELEGNLIQRTDALASQLTDLENQQVALTETDARRELETQKAQGGQRLAEQQSQELREEVERLARMLLDEADASGSINQAA